MGRRPKLGPARIATTAWTSWERHHGRNSFTPDIYEYLKKHYEATEPLKKAAATTGDLEPTQTGNGEQDLTEVIRAKAREMGFGEVGFTKYDRRYTYASKKQWVKFEHAVCVALEQDYAETQQIPSLEAEHAH